MKNKNNSRSKLNTLVKIIMQEKKHENIPAPGTVTISWPVFDHKEITNALQSLIDLRISQGPKVREFEQECAKYVGVRYAVAVNSGSSANLLALTALVASGLVPKGSEVILPATTFATVASPIIQVGLIPAYVDIDPISWNIDPKEIEKAISSKTRVIMPVHTFGNPADMKAIMKIARKYNLLVLEDCCEAHGASINGKKVGSFGDLATLSFFVAHNITTGEGGMIFTDDESMRDLLQSLREFGRLPASVANRNRFTYKDKILSGFDARYIFTRIGYNVRMTDIAASLGIEQIKKLDTLNGKRVVVVQSYNDAFRKYAKFLELPKVAKGAFHSYYGYPFVVKKSAPFTRLEFVKYLESKGIETRPFFGGCLPDQPAFRNEPQRIVGKLPVARMVRDQSVFIGCHPALTKGHVKHFLKVFESFFDTYL